jgi:N-carbamoylputrescine amidase
MPRIVKCGLIQASNACAIDEPIEKIKQANIDKNLLFIDEAAKQGVQIVCMQEVFTTPYFCAEQEPRWYESVEKIPDGPTVKLMQEVAKKHGMVVIVPIYEEEITGVYYNTAAVIDADGKYLGKYRKNHIPHTKPGFWEKYYFKPGNLGYPTFETAFARIGVYICYDRHFPEGARALGLNGAEIVFNPSATAAGLSGICGSSAAGTQWRTLPGAINRVGHEQPRDIGEVLRQGYFCNPRGKIIAQASRDSDELVVADLDLDQIREVRNVWQFYRDRRPETYGELTEE